MSLNPPRASRNAITRFACVMLIPRSRRSSNDTVCRLTPLLRSRPDPLASARAGLVLLVRRNCPAPAEAGFGVERRLLRVSRARSAAAPVFFVLARGFLAAARGLVGAAV